MCDERGTNNYKGNKKLKARGKGAASDYNGNVWLKKESDSGVHANYANQGD